MLNVPSQRVLEKAGFRKGCVYENHYVRGVHKDAGTKSSLQSFYLGRPGIEGGYEEWVRCQTPVLQAVGVEISADDKQSIRAVLENDGVERVNLART